MIDWRRLICELRGSGMSTARVAEVVSCSEHALYSLSSGRRKSEPLYSLGAALIALHAERCGKEKR